MKYILSTLSLFILTTFAFGAGPTRLYVSVVDIDERMADPKHDMCIVMTIHQPEEFRGLSAHILAQGKSREDRRKEFPIGALFSFPVSESIVERLKEAQKQQEDIQTAIDKGTKREIISCVVAPVQIESSDLPPVLTPITIQTVRPFRSN